MSPLARIVVSIDGSEDSDRALSLAKELAERFGAALTLLTVVPPTVVPSYGGPVFEPPNLESMEAIYDDVLATRKARVTTPGIPKVETVRREGIVVEELLAYLEKERPDLFIMGSRGLSAGRRLFMGSVSDALVHHAPCPVLVVRHQEPPTVAHARPRAAASSRGSP
jgi:nucleotide-binding universal stress UspA family protein